MNRPQFAEASAMTTSSTRPSQEVQLAKEQWESLLSSDREQMTDYERTEMEQDVEGRNLLAALSPAVTTNLGLKGMKKELAELRQRHADDRMASDQAASADLYQAVASFSSPTSRKRPRSPTIEQRILNSPYIAENEEILLRFIRADRLDAQKAAQRLLNYYSLAMELFGDAILTRPILLGDLDRQERKLLESGWLQLLLTRDVCGRRIISLDQAGPADPGNIVHKLRVLMYVFQVAALDEDTQKQGLHLITHRLFSQESPTGTVEEDAWMVDSQEREAMKRFFACTSVRCSVIHVNAPSSEKWSRIVPCTIKIFAADERGRIQFHHGPIADCSTAIAEYGVPIEWMPWTSTGRRKLNEHKVWIKLQHEREAASRKGQSLQVVECPRPNDILLTKTRRASSHPGNQKLRQVLEERYEERYTAHPMKKQSITSQVADHLEEKLSCRFLVKNKESLWIPAERSTVLDKLGNSFRFVPRLKKKEALSSLDGGATPRSNPASSSSTVPSVAATEVSNDSKLKDPPPSSTPDQEDSKTSASSLDSSHC